MVFICGYSLKVVLVTLACYETEELSQAVYILLCKEFNYINYERKCYRGVSACESELILKKKSYRRKYRKMMILEIKTKYMKHYLKSKYCNYMWLKS